MKLKRQLLEDEFPRSRSELLLSSGSLELADCLKISWFFPEGFEQQDVIETSRCYIVRGEQLVYKFYKSNTRDSLLPSAKQDTFSLRWALAATELQDNLELAPDIYLGLRLLRFIDGEPHWSTESRTRELDPELHPGDADEVALVMRRYQEGANWREKVTSSSGLSKLEIRRLAEKIQRFHAKRRRAGTSFYLANPEHCEKRLREHSVRRASRLVKEHGGFLDPFTRISLFEIKAFLEKNFEPILLSFRRRASQGMFVNSHGSLILDHVLDSLPETEDREPLVIGRAKRENPARYGDLLIDIASMSVDLRSRNLEDLAQVFEDSYFGKNPDAEDADSYRFYKVSALLEQIEHSFKHGGEADWEITSKRISLALSLSLGLEGPFLIGFGGSDTETRSSLAEGLSELIGSDIVSFEDEQHNPAALLLNPDCFFDRLMLRCKNLLKKGRSVSFSWPLSYEEERVDVAALASALNVPYLLVKCVRSGADLAARSRDVKSLGLELELRGAAKPERDSMPWSDVLSDRPLNQIYLENVMSQSELVIYVLREFLKHARR